MKRAEPQVASVMKLCSGNKVTTFGLFLVPLPVLSLQRYTVPTVAPTARVLHSSILLPVDCVETEQGSALVYGSLVLLTEAVRKEISLQSATQMSSLFRFASPELTVIIYTKSEWEEGDVFPKW